MSAPEGYHAALASGARRRILDALTASPIPLDSQSLAAALGLHVTTVRFHLEQLERANLVRRQTGAQQRRGRPSVLFSPAGEPRDDATRAALISVLVDALSDRGDGPAASALAGRRWADDLGGTGRNVAELTELLERLGFAPEPDGDTIRLHACPFREVARQHPEIVCSVHRGLLERAAEDDGGFGDGRVGLVPFVQPDLCLVTLGDRVHPAAS